MDSKNETVSDNELIAQFMGFVQSKSSLGNTWEHPERMGIYGGVGLKLKYDTSWDWLMPVVKKIYDNNPRAFKVDLFSGPLSPLATLYIHSPIEDVYREVVKYIRWYNSQSPDTIK